MRTVTFARASLRARPTPAIASATRSYASMPEFAKKAARILRPLTSLRHMNSASPALETDVPPPHFRAAAPAPSNYTLPHPIWTADEVKNVEITHVQPGGFSDRLALFVLTIVRRTFDWVTGYQRHPMTERDWLVRIVFLETVAGVPGMMGAMVRHLHSLRRMGRDYGWIHTLLEDAENERMHLLFAMELFQPSKFVRLMVLLAQGIFSNLFFVVYLLSPKFCHRFVGYLEEEAVKTYTTLIKQIEEGKLESWRTTPAPPIAQNYWKLGEKATIADVIYAIRADEAHHRLVNHTLSGLKANEPNPFMPGRGDF